MEIKINVLKRTANQLQKILGCKPPIDLDQPIEDLKAKVLEAARLLNPGEDKQLTKTALEVIEAIKAGLEKPAKPKKKSNKKEKKEVTEEEIEEEVAEEETEEEVAEEVEEEVEEEEEITLQNQIQDADLEDLKSLVRGNGIFKVLRKGLGIQKNVDKLSNKMLDILNPEAPKEEKKDKKKANKKEKTETKKISAMYMVRKAVCKNPELTADEVLKIIQKEGFDANIASVKIRRTEMLHAINIMNSLGKLKK